MAKGVLMSNVRAITIVLSASVLAVALTLLIVLLRRPTTSLTPDLRLPSHLVPQHYDLFLQPFFYTRTDNATNQTMVFHGNSSVTLLCLNRTKSILLHSLGLNLTQVTVKEVHSGDDILVSKWREYDDDSNLLEVELDQVLEDGERYVLFTAFKGKTEDNLSGLYMCKYNQEKGAESPDNERYMVTSQLQPTDARRVFPCFDEPAMKATFTVTIIHRDGTTALSNGLLQGSTSMVIDGEDWMVSRFQPTEKMSTYLLAFVVSEFKSIDAPPSSHERTQISVHGRPASMDAGQGEYANNITTKILTFFESYFDFKYSFPKIDQVAVPDMKAGAMENWGLIIYQEMVLLYEDKDSIFDKDHISSVVAHELAHQWFGNLVTLSWWNNLWLNEGFATYVSYLGVDHIYPHWKVMESLVKEMQMVMVTDSMEATHPLSSAEKDIQKRSEIIDLFNEISYGKGAMILRMLSDFLSERVFQLGLRKYLKTFQYSAVDEKDLWAQLQLAVDENNLKINVADVMYSWTKQAGYPLITINSTTGEVQQQRFLLNHTLSIDDDLLWTVPIRVVKSGEDPTLVLFSERGPEARPAFKVENDQWVLANINWTGYYRVNYDLDNWHNLLHQLETNHNVIPLLNRAQIIDDAFNLERAHHINISLALSTTRYLRNETDHLPWDSAMNRLENIAKLFDRSEVYGPIQAYFRKQVSSLYKHYENLTLASSVPDSPSEQHNQVMAIEVACKNHLPACESMATTLFKTWMMNSTHNPIHQNLRRQVYCTALALGGEEEWDFAWEMYQKLPVADETNEKSTLLSALACTPHIWMLNRYLGYALDQDKINKTDMVYLINSVASHSTGLGLAWDFIQEHWTLLTTEHDSSYLIFLVGDRFSTDFELQQLLDFQSKIEDFSKDFEEVIKTTKKNIQWVKENKRTVLDWFNREAKNP